MKRRIEALRQIELTRGGKTVGNLVHKFEAICATIGVDKETLASNLEGVDWPLLENHSTESFYFEGSMVDHAASTLVRTQVPLVVGGGAMGRSRSKRKLVGEAMGRSRWSKRPTAPLGTMVGWTTLRKPLTSWTPRVQSASMSPHQRSGRKQRISARGAMGSIARLRSTRIGPRWHARCRAYLAGDRACSGVRPVGGGHLLLPSTTKLQFLNHRTRGHVDSAPPSSRYHVIRSAVSTSGHYKKAIRSLQLSFYKQIGNTTRTAVHSVDE